MNVEGHFKKKKITYSWIHFERGTKKKKIFASGAENETENFDKLFFFFLTGVSGRRSRKAKF